MVFAQIAAQPKGRLSAPFGLILSMRISQGSLQQQQELSLLDKLVCRPVTSRQHASLEVMVQRLPVQHRLALV